MPRVANPRAQAFKKGTRVRILTDHWKGKDQRATVKEEGGARSYHRDQVKVKLDGVHKKRTTRFYHWTSLERLGVVDQLGELGRTAS